MNFILRDLPHSESVLLKPYLRTVRLVGEQVLVEQGHAVEHVYFVEEGLVSLVAEGGRNKLGIQVAMVGHEGLVGAAAMLDLEMATACAAVVQIPGRALRIASRDLRRLTEQCPELHRRCLSEIASLLRQVVETSASNARNSLAERCARWLLMAHQRVDQADIFITHEALSLVLGVRRSGVSVVLAGLQETGLIEVRRGRITIRDCAGLERLLAASQPIRNGLSSVSNLLERHNAAGARTAYNDERLA